MKQNNPLDVQVGGSHYKSVKIQPVEFTERNGLGFCEGNVIKYLCRWRQKSGLQDIDKAEHYLQLLLGGIKRKAYPLPEIVAPSWKANSFLDQYTLSIPERNVILAVLMWRRWQFKAHKDTRGLRKALTYFPAIREVYLREVSK